MEVIVSFIYTTGGDVFHTTDTVMRKHGYHFLSALSLRQFADETDAAGYVFIDRDPELFPLVLSYLRDGEVEVGQLAEDLRGVGRRHGRHERAGGVGRAAVDASP